MAALGWSLAWATGLSVALGGLPAHGASPAMEASARELLRGPLPDSLPTPDAPEGHVLWERAVAHPAWLGPPRSVRLVFRESWGPTTARLVELDLSVEAHRLAAVYVCLGGSIGAGSTFVGFVERTGGTTFVGVGTHSFIGDTYNHTYGEGPLGGQMMCRVLHRHYVRPGLLVGGVRAGESWGVRLRPEVSLGAFANLLVAVPITWSPDESLRVGGQLGVAFGLP